MNPHERLLMDGDWHFHLGDIKMHDYRHTWNKVRNGSREADSSALGYCLWALFASATA